MERVACAANELAPLNDFSDSLHDPLASPVFTHRRSLRPSQAVL